MGTRVNRSDITEPDYLLILEKEAHHDHEMIMDEHGTLRWKKDKDVVDLLERIDLNYLCPLLMALGYGKNSEAYRKLYRCMGYSLYGYWEIFYWEINNPEAEQYVANAIP